MPAPALAAFPFYFGSASSPKPGRDGEDGAPPLFGWFHPPQGPSRDAGVVLCNPIGDDYIRAHRALRHLAETLAEAGFAVLRFDFHGTGDSSGSERDPKRVEAWLADVPLAVAELRARSEVSKIAVVGLRLGGTMAMAACAANGGVDDLVLWNPYLTGAAYVTETTKLHKMHKMLQPQGFASEPAGWEAGGQEALGFLLTKETVDDLGNISLLAPIAHAAPRMLVISTSAEDKLLEHLRSSGSEVTFVPSPGQSFLVQINHRSDVPTAAIDAITTWLTGQHPVSAAAKRAEARTASSSYGVEQGDAERPLVFGSTHPLVGILVQPPKAKRDPKRPVIVMTNAGSVHRIGAHRSYVPMSRRWAALGFTVLRMDLSGIGDSPAAPGTAENLTYPKTALADLRDAMTAVTKATGAETFIVLGLCSGGDLAFQIGFTDPRVTGVVMMNPRTFCIHDLAMVDSFKGARHQDSFLRLSGWKKAVRGEVNVKRALGTLLPEAKNVAVQRLRRMVPRPKPKTSEGGLPAAATNDVPACLRMMAERGVDTFLVAAEKDPGVDFVDVHFGNAMHALTSVPGFRREDFLGMDHTFTSIHAQESVSQVITDHFVARYAGG